jgi:hypothetical protein
MTNFASRPGSGPPQVRHTISRSADSGPGLGFDDVVEGVAIRALEERLACRRKAPRIARYHKPPHLLDANIRP